LVGLVAVADLVRVVSVFVGLLCCRSVRSFAALLPFRRLFIQRVWFDFICLLPRSTALHNISRGCRTRLLQNAFGAAVRCASALPRAARAADLAFTGTRRSSRARRSRLRAALLLLPFIPFVTRYVGLCYLRNVWCYALCLCGCTLRGTCWLYAVWLNYVYADFVGWLFVLTAIWLFDLLVDCPVYTTVPLVDLVVFFVRLRWIFVCCVSLSFVRFAFSRAIRFHGGAA